MNSEVDLSERTTTCFQEKQQQEQKQFLQRVNFDLRTLMVNNLCDWSHIGSTKWVVVETAAVAEEEKEEENGHTQKNTSVCR